jgi:hypothetical protein
VAFEIVGLSVELIGNQASVALQQQGENGQFASIAVSFSIAPGHYSKYQVLEKTKRLLADATNHVQAEMAKSA